ncbi:MAG: nucleoside triphosphate pyrophosphohydrolase [Candidatus Sumerlaeia bacterium]|nr:nucleoside triphosphate pyrophosphohydrolase [Candidatus Sumerlaeia bacterium]
MTNNTGDKEQIGEAFYRLVQILRQLLGPGGCPWDKEQTHQTLKPFLIEEAYEVNESIDAGDFTALKEELGDLMLQIIFHAELARQAGKFDIVDVLQTICEKMLHRHPHVFGEERWHSADEVLRNWEDLKKTEQEKIGSTGKNRDSILAGIPKSLPALIRAQRLQDRAARVGFDWEHIADVFKKVEEELQELKQALTQTPEASSRLQDEFGDLLFALVNLARFLKIQPEEALQKTNEKFMRRFAFIEQEARRQGRQLKLMSLAEMDALWEQAKDIEDK